MAADDCGVAAVVEDEGRAVRACDNLPDECAAEIDALLLCDLCKARKRSSLRVAHERKIASHINTLHAGNRKIGGHFDSPGIVRLHSKGSSERRGCDAGRPDRKAHGNFLAVCDKPAFRDFGDRAIGTALDTETGELLPGVACKRVRKRCQYAVTGFEKN